MPMIMTTDRRRGTSIAAAVAAALLLSTAAQGQGDHGAPAAARRPCCHTNPQYSGPCAVQPGQAETCASILAYLNNPTSQGKTYCNSTNIRGGWKRARCSRTDTAESSTKSP